MSVRVLAGAIAALGVWLSVPAAVSAQSAENVAIVINEESESSRRVGEHYAKTRNLPPANVLRIRTTTSETVERAEFIRTIESPLAQSIRRGGLQDRILYIVLTKGIPLRVAGTSGASGTVASVDSELTLLYRKLVGTEAPPNGRVDNPYYLGSRPLTQAKPFTHREHDIYLVTRLDGFTVEDALALIDRAQTPSRDGRIVLDQRGSGNGDQWMAEAAGRLKEQGQSDRVLLEAAPKSSLGKAPVLGYYAWGASDPENQVRRSGLNFSPGSIAANLASFDARTLETPPAAWRPTASEDKSSWFADSPDALIGDMIRDGVTGVAGQVDEAYPFGAVRPEILFPAYLSGFNLVEAFYLATPSLSWQTVVIGDPLCAPFGRMPLTRQELGDEVDSTTGYPSIFGRRRAQVVTAANRDVPEKAITALMRSQALLDREDRPGARRALAEVVELAPRAVGPIMGLAELEEQLGEYDSAIERYRLVLATRPGHVGALNNLAYNLATRRNSPQEALPLAIEAAKQVPLNGLVLDTLAWIHHLLGNNELAAKLLTEAVRFEPGQAELRLHAAIVFMAIGNTARAESELKEALRINPTVGKRDDVQRLLQQLRP